MVLLINQVAKINSKLRPSVYANLTTNFQNDVKSVIDTADILENPLPTSVTFNAHTLLQFIVSTLASDSTVNPEINAFNIKFTKLSGDIVNDERFNPVNTNQVSVIIEPASVEWGERIIPATGAKVFDIITSRNELSFGRDALDFGTIAPPY